MNRLLDTLEYQVHSGEGSLIELELLHYISSNFESNSDDALCCALYCVRKRLAGNICVSLIDMADDVSFFESIAIRQKSLPQLKKACEEASFFGSPGDLTPLILKGDLLYFQKFWEYEEELTGWLFDKSKATQTISSDSKEFITELFKSAPNQISFQEVATYLALAKDLVILTGAPGTGKTYTIKRIVQALLNKDPNASIAFAAPTGKAAQRMSHSISEFASEFSLPQATTLHKLLEIGMNGKRERNEAKLSLDVLVVDEASMLDLSLWIAMIRSLPEKCKLILLGDKDQLASVEAGAILGDLCYASDNSFSDELSNSIGFASLKGESKNKLNDCIIELNQSYRFDESSGISALAEAINNSDTAKVFELLDSSSLPQISRREATLSDLEDVLYNFGQSHYNDFLSSGFSFEVLKKRQILCALRRGSFSSQSINEHINNSIKRSIHVSLQQEWYQGMPILITRNNNLLNVYNGEVGYITTENSSKNPEIVLENKADFSLSLSRFNELESSFAITVHKSQGSEYDHVVIFLGNKENHVLSKQLLYTAVTRARKSVLIVGSKEIIIRTIEKTALRRSGIRQKILLDS